MGSVAALLSVRPGYETAVAAALGRPPTQSPSRMRSALDAVGHLKEHDLGRAGMLLGDAPADDYASWPPCRTARRTRRGGGLPADPAPGLAGCSARSRSSTTYQRRSPGPHLPDVLATTRARRRAGCALRVGGSEAAPSLIEVQSAVDEAAEKLTEATARSERLRFELAGDGGRAGPAEGVRRDRAGPAARVGRRDGGGGRAVRAFRVAGQGSRGRRSGWPRRSRRPRRSATRTCPGSPSSRSG